MNKIHWYDAGAYSNIVSIGGHNIEKMSYAYYCKSVYFQKNEK